MNDELERIIVAELDAVGFDLVEARRGGSRAHPVIEVRIDRRDGAKVAVDDCARASRAIEAKLDGSPLVSERYELQVSSPGERQLRTPAEWQRFVGRWVNVLTPAHGGRFEARVVALNGVPGAEVAELELESGEHRRVPLVEVKDARLAFRL